MFPSECAPTRRTFLNTAAALTTAVATLSIAPEMALAESDVSDVNVIGPKKGYSPQIGTLVSMMTWMRQVILIAS